MRDSLRILLFILLVFFGLQSFKSLLFGIESIIFVILPCIPLFFLFVCYFCIIYFEIKWKEEKSLFRKINIIFGGVILFILLLFSVRILLIEKATAVKEFRTAIGKEPFYQLKIKKNGWIKLEEWTILGNTVHYGTYAHKDSNYIFHFSKYEKNLENMPKTATTFGNYLIVNNQDTLIFENGN